MLIAMPEKDTNGEMILRMKGRLGDSSAIYIGTLLEEAINNGITHLTLDFSAVLDFDYTGIALSVAVLNFYEKDFSEITCCGLPQNITDLFRVFMVHRVSPIKVASIDDDPKRLAVSNL